MTEQEYKIIAMYLKSSMDRFIDDFLIRRKLRLYNLKSSMDRFIVPEERKGFLIRLI